MKVKKFLIIFIYFLVTNILIVFAFKATNVDNSLFVEFQSTVNQEDAIPDNNKIPEIKPNEVEASSYVRLLLPESEKIINVNIEDYIVGVLTGEMYSDAPHEALKAMAVAARTYTAYECQKNKSKEYDLTANHEISQAYIPESTAIEAWGESGENKYNVMKKAVEETQGQVLCYNGQLILALYHASSYPRTENSENVFIEALDYLVGVESGESFDKTYVSHKSITVEELNNLLLSNAYPALKSDSLKIKIVTNENGRCKYMIFEDEDVKFTISGKKVRNLFGLKSTSIKIKVSEKIEFEVYGYGHGVGLSQNGAVIMAKSGKTYDEILKNYYFGADIYKTIYR